uniref:Uncharacterized protein n=1 Tax=Leersia perrieri TaxID=77586 RepID=A0A0D9VMK2_9ORYZ
MASLFPLPVFGLPYVMSSYRRSPAAWFHYGARSGDQRGHGILGGGEELKGGVQILWELGILGG